MGSCYKPGARGIARRNETEIAGWRGGVRSVRPGPPRWDTWIEVIAVAPEMARRGIGARRTLREADVRQVRAAAGGQRQ